MILELGRLIWPTIEENEVTMTKKYAELSAIEKLQADCDMTEINNILYVYQLKSIHLSIITELPRIYGKSSTSYASFPPKWSKFVTDVKLVKYLHTTNFNQLYAYLQQHKLYANEVRLMREHNQDPLALVVNRQMTPPRFNTYQSSYNNPQF
nr:hypothetical protein [Tanacetum cinerariifolium]